MLCCAVVNTGTDRIRRTGRRAAALGIVLAALPVVADACRCAQRPLWAYFEQAGVVALVRVTANEPIEATHQRTLTLEPIETFKGQAPLRMLTGLSSAACGVNVPVGTELVVFALPDPDRPGTVTGNTCTGTRVHAPGNPAGDFNDVASTDVLATLESLAQTGSPAPEPSSGAVTGPVRDVGGVPLDDSLIGLVTIPALTGDGPPRPVTAYAEATGQCGRRVLTDRSDIVMREASYEQPAAVLHEIHASRYRIALADAPSGVNAWVPRESVGEYWPLVDLLPNRLTYLTADWDGRIWPFPGAGSPRLLGPSDAEPAVEVVGSTDIGGSTWFEVRVLDSDPCAGGTPEPAHRGWIPAWNSAGKLSIWFHSRGC